SSRSLSVLGRATVAKSLLLSMCWYLFRVTPLPSSEVDKIKAAIGKFIHRNIFPKIKWSNLCLPKHQGGLAILDPLLQQRALYLFWLRPLFHDSGETSTNRTYISLKIHLQNSFNSEHPEIPLLFPIGRKQVSKKQFGVCNLLTQAMDQIPRRFEDMTLNFKAIMSLPIESI
ncbi:hypothetical protein BY458DRAFT_417873, partial [Sporodiniella umbellata]